MKIPSYAPLQFQCASNSKIETNKFCECVCGGHWACVRVIPTFWLSAAISFGGTFYARNMCVMCIGIEFDIDQCFYRLHIYDFKYDIWKYTRQVLTSRWVYTGASVKSDSIYLIIIIWKQTFSFDIYMYRMINRHVIQIYTFELNLMFFNEFKPKPKLKLWRVLQLPSHKPLDLVDWTILWQCQFAINALNFPPRNTTRNV